MKPKISLGPYQALLFDMDGTLLDSHAAVKRAWGAWADRVGAPREELLTYMVGRRAIDTIRHYAHADMNIEEEVHWLDVREHEDLEGIVPIRGALEMLLALPTDKWAIVTSANGPLARLRIAAAGLPSPRVIVPSNEVTHGKPHPEGYLKAANLLGVDARQSVVFEDADAGVGAGHAAGADVVLIRHHAEQHDLPVKATIGNYEGLQLSSANGLIQLQFH